MAKRRGILMIEVGLGATLLGVMVVGALGVLRTGVTGTAQSLRLTQALHAARAGLDAAESLGYDELADDVLQPLVARIEVPAGVSSPRVDPIEVVQRRYPDGTFYRAKVITVRVGWTRAEGRQEHGEVVLRGLSLLSH